MAINLLARLLPSRPNPAFVAALARETDRADYFQQRLDQQVRGQLLGNEYHEHAARQAQERIARLGRLLASEIRAHDETKRVLVERQDQAGRVQYLERELKDMESSRDELLGMADQLRVANQMVRQAEQARAERVARKRKR